MLTKIMIIVGYLKSGGFEVVEIKIGKDNPVTDYLTIVSPKIKDIPVNIVDGRDIQYVVRHKEEIRK